MRRRLLMVALLVVLAVTPATWAHPLELVPVSHWAYDALRQLAAVGVISFQELAQQPLTVEEVTRLVDAAAKAAAARTLSPGVRNLLTALREAFPAPPSPRRPMTSARAKASGDTASALGVFPTRAAGVRLDLATGTGDGGWFAFVQGTWTGSALELSRAYLSGKLGTVYLQAGREVQRWGPSPRTSLVLAEQAGGLDLLRLAFDWGPTLRLTKFGALLTTNPTRYLIGTRLDWMVNARLRIGLSELVVTRPSPLNRYWILNPLPVILTNALDVVKLRQRFGASDVDNPFGGVDFEFRWRPGVVVYGQALVDDISAKGDFPSRVGGMVGLFWVDPFRTGRTSLRLEYSGVLNWTYTDMAALANHIAVNGRPLGFWLGNDAQDIYLELTHVLTPWTAASGWLASTRHGEGRIGQNWGSGENAWANYWMSGVVETRHAVGGQYEFRTPSSTTRYWGEIGYAQNRNNVSGSNGFDLRLGVEFVYGW